MFENYYKVALKPEFKNDEEFKSFWEIMKDRLPVTFRLSPNFTNF